LIISDLFWAWRC